MADIKTAMGQMIQNEKDNLAKVLDTYFKDNPKVYNIEFVAAHTAYLNIGCVNAKYGGKYYVQYALNEILRDSSGYTLVISQWGDNPSDESEYINLADIYPLPGELTELLLGNSPSGGYCHGASIPTEVLIDALRLRHLDVNTLQKVFDDTHYMGDEQTFIDVLRARGWKGELRQEYSVVI